MLRVDDDDEGDEYSDDEYGYDLSYGGEPSVNLPYGSEPSASMIRVERTVTSMDRSEQDGGGEFSEYKREAVRSLIRVRVMVTVTVTVTV